MIFSFFQLWRLIFLEPLGVQRHIVPHLKALIFSSLEPEGQRAWPPNKATTPLEMKTIKFHSSGRGGFVWGPRPLSFWLRGTEYQGFHMRYHLPWNSDWLIIYRPKRQTENLPMPFYMSASVHIVHVGQKMTNFQKLWYRKVENFRGQSSQLRRCLTAKLCNLG